MKIENVDESFIGRMILLLGYAGSGKTAQAMSLPRDELLLGDLENSRTTLQGSGIKRVPLDCWQDVLIFATLAGGYNPNLPQNNKEIVYSKAWYDVVKNKYPDIAKSIDENKYLYFDSATRASDYAKEYFNSKGLKGWDLFKALGYGLIDLFHQLKRAAEHNNKVVICTGAFRKPMKEDPNKAYEIIIDGELAPDKIEFIFDDIFTLVSGADIIAKSDNPEKEEKRKNRYFVCKEQNPFRFIAKEHTGGRLGTYEIADLGAVLEKIGEKKEAPNFFQKPSCVRTQEEVEQMKKEQENE